MRGRIRGFAYRNCSRAVSASLSLLARVHFLLKNPQIILNHDDFVKNVSSGTSFD